METVQYAQDLLDMFDIDEIPQADWNCLIAQFAKHQPDVDELTADVYSLLEEAYVKIGDQPEILPVANTCSRYFEQLPELNA